MRFVPVARTRDPALQGGRVGQGYKTSQGQDAAGVGFPRQVSIDISEHFFRLTTESVRLRSNETHSYQTLATLVNARAASAAAMDHDSDVLRSHLDKIPTEGGIRIKLRVTASSAENLSEAQHILAKQLGQGMSAGDMLSLLLFDYIVEQKAKAVVAKLREQGLDLPPTQAAGKIASDSQQVSPSVPMA